MQTPRTEFAQALKAIAVERGLDSNVILETIKQAIIAAYRRDAKERGEDAESQEYDVELNSTNGEARVFAWPISDEEATEEEKANNKKQKKDVTPPGFGRIAAQTAKQVIHQKTREAEKGVIMDEFAERVGTLISGMILRFDGPSVRVDIGRTEAIMPAEERVSNERLDISQRLTFLLKEIYEGPKGKELILSRADPVFVEKLFAREVPEIASGNVIIKAISREAGVRTKIAVFSSQSGVDPVGSCVGQKGVRVQAVTNELGGERVDIIPWDDDPAELIKASLSPAEEMTVVIDEENKIAHVKAPEDQLSMAIGKDGQNVRLAAKLTGHRIEVEGIVVKAKKKEKQDKTAGEETVAAVKKADKKEEVKPAEGMEEKTGGPVEDIVSDQKTEINQPAEKEVVDGGAGNKSDEKK